MLRINDLNTPELQSPIHPYRQQGTSTACSCQVCASGRGIRASSRERPPADAFDTGTTCTTNANCRHHENPPVDRPEWRYTQPTTYGDCTCLVSLPPCLRELLRQMIRHVTHATRN